MGQRARRRLRPRTNIRHDKVLFCLDGSIVFHTDDGDLGARSGRPTRPPGGDAPRRDGRTDGVRAAWRRGRGEGRLPHRPAVVRRAGRDRHVRARAGGGAPRLPDAPELVTFQVRAAGRRRRGPTCRRRARSGAVPAVGPTGRPPLPPLAGCERRPRDEPRRDPARAGGGRRSSSPCTTWRSTSSPRRSRRRGAGCTASAFARRRGGRTLILVPVARHSGRPRGAVRRRTPSRIRVTPLAAALPRAAPTEPALAGWRSRGPTFCAPARSSRGRTRCGWSAPTVRSPPTCRTRSCSPGPTAGAPTELEAELDGRGPARIVRTGVSWTRRRSTRCYRRRGRRRVPVAVRGVRAAGDRGDGAGRARARIDRPGRARRPPATPRCSSTPMTSPRSRTGSRRVLTDDARRADLARARTRAGRRDTRGRPRRALPSAPT